ncbi:GH25275 [Drosophila grimshawi]|uniref:GH25275 n=1 Tax=Drosophila grimshawi TaxID=7222 RepID=B4K4B4_DROGR|nr:GH25275 [Drosophila grimshawi]
MKTTRTNNFDNYAQPAKWRRKRVVLKTETETTRPKPANVTRAQTLDHQFPPTPFPQTPTFPNSSSDQLSSSQRQRT